MTVAYSDSIPTLFVVHGRAKLVLWAKTAQSLTCYFMEKPHTGLDDCLNMLLPCFRKRMSVLQAVLDRAETGVVPPRQQRHRRRLGGLRGNFVAFAAFGLGRRSRRRRVGRRGVVLEGGEGVAVVVDPLVERG